MPSHEQQAVVREADDAVAAWRPSIGGKPSKFCRSMPTAARNGRRTAARSLGKVKRLIHGRNDERAVLLELVGSSEPYFLPLDDSGADVAEGACLLVVGVASPKRSGCGTSRVRSAHSVAQQSRAAGYGPCTRAGLRHRGARRRRDLCRAPPRRLIAGRDQMDGRRQPVHRP